MSWSWWRGAPQRRSLWEFVVPEKIHTPSMEVIGNNIYGGEVSDRDQTSRVRYVKRGRSSWEMCPFTVPLWWCIDIFQNYKIKICAVAVNTFPSFTQNVTAHPQSMVHSRKFDWLLWECAAPENIHIPPTERIRNSGGEKSDKNQNFRVCVKERGKSSCGLSPFTNPPWSGCDCFLKLHN